MCKWRRRACASTADRLDPLPLAAVHFCAMKFYKEYSYLLWEFLKRLHPSPLLTGYPWNHKLDIFRSRSICESCRKSGTKFLKIFCTHIRRSDSKLLDFQVPRYLKSGLGRAGLGPGPVAVLCWGARRPPPRPSTGGPVLCHF